jgi:hypothetical protein
VPRYQRTATKTLRSEWRSCRDCTTAWRCSGTCARRVPRDAVAAGGTIDYVARLRGVGIDFSHNLDVRSMLCMCAVHVGVTSAVVLSLSLGVHVQYVTRVYRYARSDVMAFVCFGNAYPVSVFNELEWPDPPRAGLCVSSCALSIETSQCAAIPVLSVHEGAVTSRTCCTSRYCVGRL